MVTARADFWSGTTARARRFKSPLREFLRTESGGAAVLLAATAAALVWVNVDTSSYQQLWESVLAIDVGGGGVELTLREWVNSGLMTFFFFVLGLEARREFDLGDLRERRRFVLPLLASVGGMGAAVAIYLAFNLGSSGAAGWGIAMSTEHGVRPGIAHAVRPAGPGPPAGVHADGRPRGRLARACRDRALLQRLDRRHGVDLGGRPVRRGDGAAARPQASARGALLRGRHRD